MVWPLVFIACLVATVRPSTQVHEPPAGTAGQTIVVAPFRNLSQHADDAWIGAGIVATVSSDLQNIGFVVLRLPVVPELRATNAGAGNGSTREPDSLETLRALGATWLVDGTFQRLGDRLRITARLVGVGTGAVHHSVKLDGTVTDLFAAQDRIVEALTAEPATIAGVGAAGPTASAARARPSGEPRAVAERGPGELENGGAVSAADVTGALTLEDPPPSRPTGPSAGAGQRGASGFAASPIGARPTTVIGRTVQTPRIDGRLDDAVWETATHITEFVQMAPIEGAPGTEDTEVWMAYDDDNLYFAFYAHYSDPGMMRVFRADRDEIRGDDRISVLFDTFLDQQRAYQFTVNGYGVQGDSIANATGTRSTSSRSFSMRSGGGGTGTSSGGGGMSGMSSSGSFGIFGDDSWNALFETGGAIVSDGWTAEMAIPFKSLRYPARPGGVPHQWGFQITRIIRGKSESQSWAPVSRAVAGQLTQFGVLDGLSDLSQSRNIEILPELTGVQFGSIDTGSGQFGTRDPDGELGVGVKYGITPNLTADVTYNPDFSQIESDRPQVEVNQRFALFYPEQRPFFLEGQDIFETSTPLNLVHTRTIVDPRLGAKLTGKLGDTTLGLVIADDEAPGRVEADDPNRGRTAQSFIGRARYDLYSESYIGGIATAREFGDTYNRITGVDGRLRLGRTQRVSFLAVASETNNELEGRLGGPAIEADFTNQGRNLGYGVSYSSIDPEFRTETGFVPRVDLRQTSANVSYRWWPESTLLSWGPSLTYLRLYDYAGVLQDEQVQGSANLQFRNNVMFFGTLSRSLERFAEVDFRKNSYGLFGVVSQRVFSFVGGFNWGDGIFYGANPFLGRSTTGNFLFRWNATSRLRTELTGVFSSFVEPIGASEIFSVKIFRTRTTYQFTDRLLLRHIMEHNTLSVTLGNNVLLTYRINGGTVAFLGFDDRYQRGSRFDNVLFPTTALQRTNRAFFGKISYLFRM